MLARAGYEAKRLRELARAIRLERQLEAHDRMPRADIEALQRRSVAKLVRHAAERSPFYRERLAGIDLSGEIMLSELPTVTREQLMGDFESWVTDPRLTLTGVQAHLEALDRPDDYHLGRYRAMTTGGSSGKKGVFVFDRREWSLVLALTLRWSRLMAVGPRLPNRIKSAVIAAGSPLHITYRVAVTADVGLARILRLEATMPIPELVDALNDFEPEHVHAYPSIAALLADEQQAGRLDISPRVVSTSSELRTDEMTERIRAAWKTEPFDCYGITEVGLFGNDCDYHRGIHAFDDLFIFEVVDEQGRPVPDGEVGHHLLVTNLFDYTQPLIRYEITDMIAVNPEPCPCGRPFPLIKSLEGRSDDILYLPDVQGGEVPVHPMHFRSPMAAAREVRQYEIVQRERDILVRAVLADGSSPGRVREQIAAALERKLRQAGAKPPALEFEFVDAIERDPRTMSKLKLVRSEVPRASRASARSR